MTKTKQDICTTEDINHLVNNFYQKALTDDKIGHFFTEVIFLEIEKHLPIICLFWESILFNNSTYKGNPMVKHLRMHQKHALSKSDFNQWIALWEQTVNQFFKGEKAQKAIESAKNIGNLMQFKLNIL